MIEKRIEQVTGMGPSCIMILLLKPSHVSSPVSSNTLRDQIQPAPSSVAGFEVASLDPTRLSYYEGRGRYSARVSMGLGWSVDMAIAESAWAPRVKRCPIELRSSFELNEPCIS
jgi:hypothetical protein